MERYFITIDYDEMNPAHSYNGCVLTKDDDKIQCFNTGDPVRDWEAVVTHCAVWELNVTLTSSVDHFVMDNEGYYFDSNEMLQSEIDYLAQKAIEGR